MPEIQTRFRYTPEIGKRLKLAELWMYSKIDVHGWAWMKVVKVHEHGIKLEVLNGDQPTGVEHIVPREWIKPPIGWEERYTITVKPEQVEQVKGWLSRGIAVRQCQDLSNAGARQFQPADNCPVPHWAYKELTDVVPADQCRDRIRIVMLEQRDTGLNIPSDRIGKQKRIQELEAEGWRMHYVRQCGGYWAAERETVVKDWGRD